MDGGIKLLIHRVIDVNILVVAAVVLLLIVPVVVHQQIEYLRLIALASHVIMMMDLIAFNVTTNVTTALRMLQNV